MTPTRFCYLPTLNVELTRTELTIMRAACERHYDSAVVGLSVPGPEAVLNAANTQFLAQPEATSTQVEFTYQQLDLLAKALERATTHTEHALYLTARMMMNVLGREADRINKAPQPDVAGQMRVG